jgi:hypothetical protein
MNTEIRVYICDSEDWYTDTPNADIETAMECAEAQGTVMTLPTFIEQFNNGELTDLLSKGTVTISMAEFIVDSSNELFREIK